MLVNLYIKNYILIQELSVSLSDRFNVFTGETGAGKSLVVDALNFVTGERSKSSVVGKHGNRALVEASFSVSPTSSFYKELELLGYIESEDDLVIVSREISKDGRNVCRINGRTVNVSTMKDVLSKTLDIHSQHETQYLLNTTHQLKLLDMYLNDSKYLQHYQETFHKYKQIVDEIHRLKTTTLSGYELEFAKTQLNEIEAFKPSSDEYEAIRLEIKQLDDYEKNKSLLNDIESTLTGSKDVLGSLFSIKDHFNMLSDLKEGFDDVYYRLEDISYQVSKINSETSFDAIVYEKLQDRLYKYNQMIRKYLSLEGLFEKKKELETMIHAVEHHDQLMEDLDIELKKVEDLLAQDARLLRNARVDASKRLIQEVVGQCRDLMLENVRFDISFDDIDYSESGKDRIVFMVSMNKGEALQPLASAASGGELSRVMLAMKVIFSKLQGITTLVFDEIDTGVSGKVSLKIGEKMKTISKDTQVLTITHYGTVAACAHNHYLIEKSEDHDHTITSVKRLKTKERVHELALMMSGNEEEASLLAASQLFEQGQSL
ncbi:hypothetical protein AOC36_04895 [Erysipelothrix larvae]|uniref:DNA repair protein RecN n=1 Tax=Erysipelothrix larvae TaxID=1514105 RepID=A0A0X8GZP2_9FIRM|nr:DNA repair protein RecN [Erysipelothrix larvae]AMC93335.1 hypothetical protein AOC36_04895 [Erysipelothrix larvae]